MTGLRRWVTGFLLLKLGVLVLNLVRFPVLERRCPPGPAQPWMVSDPVRERVSLLIPIRNEQDRLLRLLPALLAQDADEVLVLDDESSDGTPDLARALLVGHPTARLIAGGTAPTGWRGKNWACEQLAAAATGQLLVFCDCDVVLAPGALAAALTEMRAQRAEVFSVFPRQLTPTIGEHLVIPLIDDVLLCFLPFPLLGEPIPSAATANGSVLIFTRTAYDRLGGFAAVRDAVVEDVTIARRARAQGLQLGLALGGDAIATRMYDGYAEVVTGLSRGLLGLAGNSRSRLIAAAVWQLAVYTLPWLMVRRRPGWFGPLLLGLLERALVDLKTGRGLDWRLILNPLSPPALVPVVGQALRPVQRWKGREL